ncbi:lymphocyte antigen 75-like [Kryptolebias marmoratus]|uniref:lymphocyte antigen 75-like n=1 Tax=Kryptolebias marmoratus TaxID=37003 RepID=UPI0018ACEAC5|nr:lymphocyte antigen 75-like [Kryptolebias marmoratus]
MFMLSGLCSCLRPYTLITEQKNWTEAQKYCQEKYTDLARVDSMEDIDELIAAGGSFSGTVWIGLYDKWWSWRWSAPNGFDFRNSFVNWYSTEPGNPRNLWELCGALWQGFWHDINCNVAMPFVCYNNTAGDLNTTNRIYFFINESKKWHEAQAYCRMYHTDLGKVLTQTENKEILRVVPNDTVTLIGLYRPTWKWWSDGTTHIFEHWVQGHPQGRTGNCAASLIDAANVGKLMEFQCGITFPFMCYGFSKEPPRKYVRNIRLTALKSTIDLSNPAVTEAILTQMKQKLGEKGITKDLNLTWIKQPDKKIFYKEEN